MEESIESFIRFLAVERGLSENYQLSTQRSLSDFSHWCASKKKKINNVSHITLPLLKPLIIINVLLSIGRIFYADFGLFYQVTRNAPELYPTTDVIDTYVYRTLTTIGDVGMASAAGTFQAVVGFFLVLLSNWMVRRTEPQSALF